VNFAEAAFFADFGADATLNGAPVRVDDISESAEAIGFVAGYRRLFLAPTAAAAAPGQTLVVGAVVYTVAEVASDGTGIDRLTLEKT
jgi:hypothetical protein